MLNSLLVLSQSCVHFVLKFVQRKLSLLAIAVLFSDIGLYYVNNVVDLFALLDPPFLVYINPFSGLL